MDRGGSWASMTTDSLLVNMLQAAPHQVAWIQETKLNVLKCLCRLNGSNSVVYCLYMNIQQILAIPSGDCVHCPCPLLETKIYIKCYCSIQIVVSQILRMGPPLWFDLVCSHDRG
ncbi:hypothetical protein KP509_10G003700 [Ceratopteris richardii]|uniref:Uncharacterized protein n=1 Tax=Ceratopteris richardii TaxID=49495 RepID=A0A8T2TY43_CERRI|nr:hypothetical protein KP509_10G003700 [Ceratopteris richardii]